MSDLSENCQELLEEYQTLLKHLEDEEFTNPDLDELSDDYQDDRDRLAEIKEELEDECDIEILDDDETDIDLPDYADGSPSEPMDFDAE